MAPHDAQHARTISESERIIRELYAITADHEQGFETQVKRLLRMGLERFDLDIGILAHVSSGIYRVVHAVVSDPKIQLQDGACFDLGQTFCNITLQANGPRGFEYVGNSEIKSHPAYRAFGLESYIGAPVFVDGEVYGTLNFSSPRFRERAFRDVDIDCLQLMASWVGSEIKRRRMEQELEHTVARLASSNEQLAGFAYRVSHDLQEPLRAVASYCDLIEKRYGTGLDDKGKQWVRRAVDGARRMQRLVSDLLTYARIDSANEPLAPTRCEGIVDATLANLAGVIADCQATIIVSLPLPVVAAHPAPLLQVFQNLIGNALKYRRDVPPEIHVSATVDGETTTIAIRDNGIGIAREHHERVFDLFKRFAPTGDYQGTGIGLSISKSVVARYGGRIWVESELGRGSTFFFTLPLAVPAEPKVKA